MKKTKKLISLLLSIVMLFTSLTCAVSAYAKEKVQPRISFSATLKIISCPTNSSLNSSSGLLGHSFLVVTNVGNSTITVGHMNVPVGESITLGTFSNRSKHNGIWYNIEGYCGLNKSYYGLTTALTGSDLTTLNKTINANDNWTVSKNCSYFAKTVWNSVSSVKVSGTNPTSLSESIQKKSNYDINPKIPSKSINTIAYQTSTGVKYDTSGANKS